MEKYKVVIVGAGIAGMSAAINLKRAGITPLIIENNAPGGTLNYIPNIENYPGFESISGPDLAMNIYNQVNNLDIKIKSANISDIDLDKKIFYKNLISDEEYHGCYQQLKIIRYLFDLNNCNEFTNKL